MPSRRHLPRRAHLVTALVALTTLAVSACGSPRAAQEAAEAASSKVPVTAGFYPLAYAAQRVGGAAVAVFDLTKPGAEPHDAEPTTADVSTLRKSQVLLTVKGFQPAVDALVAQATTEQRVVDAATVAGAVDRGTSGEGADLHFWLDPIRFSAYVAAVADAFAAADPPHAAAYRANAEAFRSELAALDAAYATGLKTCASRTMVTGHEAFGYLAARYGLTQVGIAGVNPEQEPSAKDLAAVAETVRSVGVRTIYTETLVEPKFAQTVASSTGAKLAVLDPVEGITDASPGTDYLQVMRANLAALRAGQQCS
ncbi:MAG: zinc ABC transporter substrate-binding protein [Actinomycetales bacterium]|nr:zinc ABC transporter substrate-binding protein [Actinomycetales bacterium]